MKKLVFIILLLAGFVKVHANCTTGFVGLPVVEYVTVDIAGDITICWQPVVDPDLAYYVIVMESGNPPLTANDSIDQVAIGTGTGTICYTFSYGAAFSNSDIESIKLGVVAVDACTNWSFVGENYHNTMLLDYTFDPCNASASLTWNAYDDFTSGTAAIMASRGDYLGLHVL